MNFFDIFAEPSITFAGFGALGALLQFFSRSLSTSLEVL